MSTRSRIRARRVSPALVLCLVAACGDDSSERDEDVGADVVADTSDAAADVSDTGDDATPDVQADTTPDGGDDTGVDADAGADVDVTEDADVDTTPPPEPLTFDYNWPIFEAPADPLADSELTSCAIFQAETCEGGTVQRCDIYDLEAEAFDEDPEEMLERAYLYDRWYELYHSPDGQSVERHFNTEIAAGTPESEWGSPDVFGGWGGAGDSAIWTGTALNGFILRYLHTGTEADYQRMEDLAWTMVNFFEVTGVPGYLARHHYLAVEQGTPQNPEHIYRYLPDESGDHRDIDDPESLDFLPDHYFEVEGAVPRWSGDPSIDQYGGPMVAFPAVYGLLQDEELKERIKFHMLCYLHSLRRIEITNLQMNEQALAAFNDLFGGGDALNLDPDDIDFTTLDTIVMYVHPQLNTANEDVYPRECGDFIQMDPWREIDASSGTFILDVIELVGDIDRDGNGRNHINHFYIPSIRGGDAMHMMHLSLMAYAFTEDERYADFLRDELLTNVRTAEVAATMSALILPKYCRRFYGTNITATPLWAFNNLLADSELDVWMQNVTVVEMWEKETALIGNVNTNLMFAGSVSPEIGGDAREEALTYALEELERFGGNGGVLQDPRRTYPRTFQETVDAMPEGVTAQCPTEEERATCERPTTIFGVEIEGENISFECTGDDPSECVMEDGMCTRAVASHPLQGPLRRWGDYHWQRSPFSIGEFRNGRQQSAGTDYAEQYWMARFYGFIDAPTEVLAWNDTGESCGD